MDDEFDRSFPLRPGDEDLRFIRSFHDIFISIGLAMLAFGLGIVGLIMSGEKISDNLFDNLQQGKPGLYLPAAFFAGCAVVMWVLAEFFSRRRRQALPAMVILLAFVAFTAIAVGSALAVFSLGSLLTVTAAGSVELAEQSFADTLKRHRWLLLVTAALTTLATFAYYLRMRLPFAMGLGGVGLAVSGAIAIGTFDPDVVIAGWLWILLAAGIFLFGLGVGFDSRDPMRVTRFSDNGFWLHFFAAPMIFVAVTSLVGQSAGSGGEKVWAIGTLLVVLAFAFISVLINRRALLVSGLLSAVIAIALLVDSVGLGGSWTAAITLLMLGGAMVLLGSGWQRVRGILIAPFPKTGLVSRIIPPVSVAE